MASEKELCESVNSNNVFSHLQHSIKNGLETLLERCIECIIGDAEAIINAGSGFIDLSMEELKSIFEVLIERDEPEVTKISNQLLFKWTDADPNRSSSLFNLVFPSNKQKECLEFESTSRYNFDMSKLLQIQMRQFEMQRADTNKQNAFIIDNYNQILSKALEIVQEQNKQVRKQGEKNAKEVMIIQKRQENLLAELNEQKAINRLQNERILEERERSEEKTAEISALKKAQENTNRMVLEQKALLERYIYWLRTTVSAFVVFCVAYWAYSVLRSYFR